MKVELGVGDGGVVFAFLVDRRGFFVAHGDRSPGAAQHVEKPYLLHLDVVDPHLARGALGAFEDADVELELRRARTVESGDELVPVGGAGEPWLPGVQAAPVVALGVYTAQHGGLDVLGLDPEAKPVLAVRPDGDLLNDVGAAVRFGAEALQSQGGFAAMEDAGIDGRVGAREIAVGPVALVLLEAAVDKRSGVFGRKPRLPALHHEQRILGRHALGEVLIVRQNASAVTRAEHRGYEVQMVALADGLDLFEPGDVLRRLQVEPVESGRVHDRGEPVLGGGAGDIAEPLQRTIGAEFAGNVDPALGVNLLLAPQGRTCNQKRNQYAFLHGFLSAAINSVATDRRRWRTSAGCRLHWASVESSEPPPGGRGGLLRKPCRKRLPNRMHPRQPSPWRRSDPLFRNRSQSPVPWSSAACRSDWWSSSPRCAAPGCGHRRVRRPGGSSRGTGRSRGPWKRGRRRRQSSSWGRPRSVPVLSTLPAPARWFRRGRSSRPLPGARVARVPGKSRCPSCPAAQ